MIINSYDLIIYLFIYVTLLFKTEINTALVLKYHGDVLMCARKEIILL